MPHSSGLDRETMRKLAARYMDQRRESIANKSSVARPSYPMVKTKMQGSYPPKFPIPRFRGLYKSYDYSNGQKMGTPRKRDRYRLK